MMTLGLLNTNTRVLNNFTEYIMRNGIDSVTTKSYSRNDEEIVNTTTPGYNITNGTGNETLEELNFRYAQTLLPFAFILGLFCFIGIIGNFVVIMVFLYSKEYRRTNFKVFVLCLACVDLVSCITLMPAEIVKTRHFFSISEHTPCKVKCFFNIFAMNASAYILLVICIDRYRKVCQPLKKQIWPSLAIKVLIGALLLSFLLSIPAPIMCGVTEHIKSNLYGTNITVFVCSAEEKYHRSLSRYLYKFGLSLLLVIIAVALIVMYAFIMKAVIQHWRKREPGETIRFESSRSPEPSVDKVEVDRISNNENVFVNFKTAEGEAHVNAFIKVYLGGFESGQKLNDESKRLRRFSASSKSSPKGRLSVNRSSSDVSFRAHVIRRHLSSAAAGRLPYKTLIWFVLTLIFLITFIINAGLSFMTTKEYLLSPKHLFWFSLFFRLYFINNIINPVIYVWLDKRFKRSFRNMMSALKSKVTCL